MVWVHVGAGLKDICGRGLLRFRNFGYKRHIGLLLLLLYSHNWGFGHRLFLSLSLHSFKLIFTAIFEISFNGLRLQFFELGDF